MTCRYRRSLDARGKTRVANVLLITPRSSHASVPELSLLAHHVTTLAPADQMLTESASSDVIIIDARDDLVGALSLIHISEPTRRTPISYAVFCLKKKK